VTSEPAQQVQDCPEREQPEPDRHDPAVHFGPHIWARVGRTARIPLRRCSAASCLGVSPAHTPCISAAGNSSAYSRQFAFYGQYRHSALAYGMYEMSLYAFGNIAFVCP
jgi:hypothetical protein